MVKLYSPLINGNKGFQPLAFFLDDGTKTLVMPLQNGTQKEKGWVPTFVGMTVKVRFAMKITVELVSHSLLNGNKGLQPLAFYSWGGLQPLAFYSWGGFNPLHFILGGFNPLPSFWMKKLKHSSCRCKTAPRKM